jgi:precorrin-3B C17-methyltransferase
MQDFAVISLSDLLTPRELIERRLLAAAQADFITCLYNPSSRGRPHHFQWACSLLLRHRPPETPAGWVRDIGRPGQSHCVTTLGEIQKAQLDMFCTAIIGNSRTVIVAGRMVTRRGYPLEEGERP